MQRSRILAQTFVFTIATLVHATIGKSADDACAIHLRDVRSGVETSAPCAPEIATTSGDFETWAERAGAISPPVKIHSDGAATPTPHWLFRDAGSAMLHVEPNIARIELLHVSSDPKDSAFRRSLQAPADASVLMPIGKTVALGYDSERHLVAVSRPVTIAKGTTSAIEVTRPKMGGDLVVFMATPISDVAVPRISASLQSTSRPASVTIASPGLITAIWYGLPKGELALSVQSDTFGLPATRLSMRGDRVETTQIQTIELPLLAIDLSAPKELFARAAASLTIETKDAHRAVATVSIPGAGHYEVRHAPMEQLELALKTGLWTFRQSIDLRAGHGDTARFDLKPIRITGRVTYGRAPSAAKVMFTAGDKIEVDTDDTGQYEAMLWEPRRYSLSVQLRDHAEVPAFHDTHRIEHDEIIDVTVPHTRIEVVLTDARTHKPIESSSVTLKSAWQDPQEGNRSTMQTLKAEGGHLLLPPLRSGSVVLDARADGYLDAEKTLTIADDTDETIPFELTPSHTNRQLHVTLPDGNPAAGAEVFLVSGGRLVFSGTAAEDGSLPLPEELSDGLLVARHPRAGASVQPWSTLPDSGNWQLSPIGSPVAVHVVEASGADARAAAIVLWIGDVPVYGVALALMAQTDAAIAPSGSWTLRNAPARPMRLLALRRGLAGRSIESLASLAVPVPTPVPPVVELRVVE